MENNLKVLEHKREELFEAEETFFLMAKENHFMHVYVHYNSLLQCLA